MLGVANRRLQDSSPGFSITGAHRVDDGNLSLVFCGRIDNVEALPAMRSVELGLLAAYRARGPAFLETLLGDFVIAIWDSEACTLLVARDPMGVLPVYYRLETDEVHFSVEQLALAGKEPRLDALRVADYLMYEETAHPRHAFLANVHSLPPAHYLLVKPGTSRVVRYWQPRAGPVLRLGSDREYADAFLEVVDRAVAVRATGRVGVMLSGGIDSVLVTASLLRQGIDCEVLAALSPEGETCRETEAIMAVCKHYDIKPVTATREDLEHFSATLDGCLDALDNPFSAVMVLAMVLYHRAREQGVTRVLDGVEGDLVASLPQDYMGALLREGQVAQLVREIRGGVAMPPSSYLQLAARTLRTAFTPPTIRRAWHKRTFETQLQDRLVHSPVNDDLARQFVSRYRGLYRPHPRSSTAALHEAALGRPDIDVAMARYDAAARAVGVQAAHPLLDRRVVEFCLSLPAEQKRRFRWRKWLLRTAMTGEVPTWVAWRQDKPHLGASFTHHWYTLNKPAIEASLARPLPVVSRAKLDRFRLQDDRYWQPVWNVAFLSDWLFSNGIEVDTLPDGDECSAV